MEIMDHSLALNEGPDPKIVIIDYGVGNTGSIYNMLRKLRVKAVISSDPVLIMEADKLILSGVGAFDKGMVGLEQNDLISLLHTKVIGQKTPLLGICLGMQLLVETSEEGRRPGLGWIKGEATKFNLSHLEQTRLKIPHMGWNKVRPVKESPLFLHVGIEEWRFYFVHSYHVNCASDDTVAAYANHGYDFVAAIQKDNICGVQFHPEKSHKFGLALFKNFVEC